MTAEAPRRALVTGAAGAIGAAVCGRLVADGYAVVAADLSAERLDALAVLLDGLATVVGDVASAAGADAIVEAAGHVDVLCNNVGVSDGGAAVDELSDEDFARVININLISAFALTRRVVPLMIGRGHGVIINMASVAGLRGGRTGVAYTASKWGLIGLTQNVAASLGPDGIRAHAVCPGNITGAVTLGDVPATPGALRSRGRDVGRPEDVWPHDVAALVAFLASDATIHLNGVAIPVDNGW